MDSDQNSPEEKKSNGVGKWIAALAIVVALIALSLAGAAVLSRKPVAVRIETNPAGASVWVDEHFVGAAPCETKLTPGEHLVRCVRSGRRPAAQRLIVGRSPTTFRIKLPQAASGAIRVTTEPEGALISVDGVTRGPSPVEVGDLQAGRHEIIASAEGCETVTKSITIKNAEKTEVHIALPSKIEAYYLKEIKNDPKNLHNYTELLHCYVVQGEFEKARDILTRALVAVAIGWGRIDQTMRLGQEIQKICNHSFEYKGVNKMRRIVLETIRQVIAAYPRSKWLYTQLLRACQATGDMQEAVRAFEIGVKQMPWDPWVNGELAKLYFDQGKIAEAEKAADRTIHLSRGSAVAHYVLGCICKKRGEKEKAREHFETALRFTRDWTLRKQITEKMRGL